MIDPKQPAQTVRAILFDKDGTLLDFQASWSNAYRELCLDLCAGDIKAADAMLGGAGMDLESGACAAGSVLAAGNTVDIVRFWFPQLAGEAQGTMVERIDRAFHANGMRYSVLLPGVREMLADLSAGGLALGVATSDGTAATCAALAMLEVDHYFSHVFGYDSVPQPKPAPDMVHAFCAATGVPAGEIAVIGDNLHDLEMARSAGAGTAIGVLSGNSREADLAPLADVILESARDLPAWLRSAPLRRETDG